MPLPQLCPPLIFLRSLSDLLSRIKSVGKYIAYTTQIIEAFGKDLIAAVLNSAGVLSA